MSKNTKKRSASMAVDSDAGEPELSSKVTKKAKNAGSSSAPDGKDDEGNPFWELSNKRRVGVSQFKNMCFINIREYYEKDGKHFPGKKGISLSIEQYAALLRSIPSINAALSDLGHEIEAPEEVVEAASAPKLTSKGTKKPERENFDATSDEEE